MMRFLLLCAGLLLLTRAAFGQDGGKSNTPGLDRMRQAAGYVRGRLPFEIHGFGEGALGWLPVKNKLIKNHSFNLMEGRTQLKTVYYPEFWAPLYDSATAVTAKMDLVGDGIDEKFEVEFRELNVKATPLHWLDLKVGRQVLTWGTGDLIFLNDIFPKDWVSFLIGRDDEYLKRPSDALRATAYSKWANLDFALVPFFTPDNPVRGERLSFYDPLQGRIVGTDNNLHFNRLPVSLSNMEYAGRLYRSFGSYELAAYAFKGFYKQAVGVEDARTGDLFYPRLDSVGASARGPVPRIGGIGNLEFTWYNSEDNRKGNNPDVEPSQLRYLAGYERDLWRDFTLGLQYYVEEMLNRSNYERGLPDESPYTRDECRQVLTFRLTQAMFQQNVTASLFTFFSPTDADFYMRPKLVWKMTDDWSVAIGADLFAGRHDYTMFGQFRDDNNVYGRVRYSF